MPVFAGSVSTNEVGFVVVAGDGLTAPVHALMVPQLFAVTVTGPPADDSSEVLSVMAQLVGGGGGVPVGAVHETRRFPLLVGETEKLAATQVLVVCPNAGKDAIMLAAPTSAAKMRFIV